MRLIDALIEKYSTVKHTNGSQKCRYRLRMATKVLDNMIIFKNVLHIKDEEIERARKCYEVALNCLEYHLDVDQAFKDYKFSELRDKYYLKELIEKRLKDRKSGFEKALDLLV